MTSSRLRNFLSASKALGAALSSLLLTPTAHGGIQPTHWYRMGEETQPLPAAGSIATVLHDTLSAADLDASSSPHGTFVAQPINSYDGTIATTSTTVASARYYQTSNAGSYAQGSLLSTDTTNFGIELWFSPSLYTGTAGIHYLFYNGTPGVDGWGMFLENNQIALRIGSTIFPTPALITPGNWENISLAYSDGVMTFYLNGSKIRTFTRAVVAPTGHFTLGAAPTATGAAYVFPGAFDELRSFKITSTFDPNTDLLYHAPQIYVGTASPVVSTPSGATWDLGVTNVGQPYSSSITIKDQRLTQAHSPAPGPLRIDSITLSGGDASEFTLDPSTPPAAPILGEALTYQVIFTPTSTGLKSTTLTIVSSDPDEGTYSITLTATGVMDPLLSVYTGADHSTGVSLFSDDPARIFSRVDPGIVSQEEKTFTLFNDGLADLHISGLSFAGTNPGDFIVSHPPDRTTLPPGEQTTFSVRFTPTAPGSRRALLSIGNDGRGDPSFHIAFDGIATGPEIQLGGPDGSLLSSGQAVSWGNAFYDTNTRPPDLYLGGITAISAGNNLTLAIQEDGTIAEWGADYLDQLAVPPLGGTTAVAISAGSDHSLAVKSDGTVIAWGNPEFGKTTVPDGLSGVIAVAAGSNHSLALKSDGTVVAWGDPTGGKTAVPDGLSGVTAIAASYYHSIALKSDGTVVTWGSAPGGSITPPAGLSGVIAIAAQESGRSLALQADGSIVTWGYFDTPLSISTLPLPSGPSDITAIAGGSGTAAAIRSDGTVLLSAYNNYADMLIPPAGLNGVAAVAAGEDQFVALHDSVIDFGSVDAAHAPAPKILTIRNSGSAPLHLTGASFFTGPDAARFSLSGDGALTTTLAPDANTTVAVTVSSGATTGTLRATLHLRSDAAGHPDFTVQLTAASPYTTWQLHYFASTAATGPSADDADPNHNGIPNLLEYAFGRDPLATASTGILPNYVIDSSSPSAPRFEFDYDRAAAGITLEIQGSDTLSGDWIPLARNTGGPAFTSLTTPTLQLSETPAASSAPDTDLRHLTLTASPTRFLRLQATRP